MTKELRIKKQKEKAHQMFKNYTDRQLLELIAVSLRWIGIALAILFWFALMIWGDIF